VQPALVKVLPVEHASPYSPQPVVGLHGGTLVVTEFVQDPPIGEVPVITFADCELDPQPPAFAHAPAVNVGMQALMHMLSLNVSTVGDEQPPVTPLQAHVQLAAEKIGPLVPLTAGVL
jgi:hypothetical protein